MPNMALSSRKHLSDLHLKKWKLSRLSDSRLGNGVRCSWYNRLEMVVFIGEKENAKATSSL
jgi:hypothetical protein